MAELVIERRPQGAPGGQVMSSLTVLTRVLTAAMLVAFVLQFSYLTGL
jgi:hypothetical protein